MLRSRQQGFTLLEVLLVALLMGLTAAAVTLTMGDAGPEKELKRLAQQFISATELVLDETVLSGQFVGIVVEESRYEFVYYKDEKWLPIKDDRLLALRELPEFVTLDITIDGLPLVQEDELEDESWFDEPFIEAETELSKTQRKRPDPQVLLFPSGEITAFELRVSGKNDKLEVIDVFISGDAMGRLHMGRSDETY
ncbi:type II secretion system minor pseudopilin GspH [Shewanella sp. SR44-3]|uniref:type II secretion system minor pseudopilin GspH n=1 Tax=Shewanella sp. SR44-3 TaxID=2760936 RepID=UPI0015F7978C|nr:type II secretion system minor pseudopilin GspH [Shewanella sp. SR44-3]MBB1268779.1 type II secretion system minor pseudopilin GspH [Shewanella sp. SR44-3]